jgi:sodium-dependent dicarboxylate transporter 2/3/5
MLKNRLGLILGSLVFIIIFILPEPSGMEPIAWRTTAVALLMAIFWITEAIPLYVTALLPIIFFPILNISSLKDSTSPFGHPLIFLFLGGFLLAQAIQKWGLHKRIALKIIDVIGISPKRIIAGFMIGSAVLSMWISNTATAMMMLPIGLSVIAVINTTNSLTIDEQKKFSIALLLSIAYSCSIGGVATLIGTPPNALMAAFIKENYQINIGFAEWMLIGIPFTIISLPISYLILTKLLFPVLSELDLNKNIIRDEIDKLGKISREERLIEIVFMVTAFLWIFRPLISNFLPGISDSSIAIFGAVTLFIIPSRSGEYLLEWQDAEKISWGILILFGGGLSLAQGISNSGLSEWIATAILSSGHLPLLILIILLTLCIIFLTELTSNLATIAAFLPIIASIGVGMNVNPLQLVIPATLAASCAFMLPVATPPNAIIFSSDIISIKNMSRAGIVLNLIFVIVITILSNTLGSLVFSY